MKILRILILAIFFLAIISFSYAQECTLYDHKECFNGDSWWFDSCGNRQEIADICGENRECVDGECIELCGNGVCEEDKGENCENCWVDCPCKDYERCNFGRCETYCGNGRCDEDENCMNCYDCSCGMSEECVPGNPRADERGCAPLCGNGRKDPGEDCSSCPQDAGCGPDLYCFNGRCVECL